MNIKDFQYLGFHYGLLYETLYGLSKKFNFHHHRNQLLVDFVIARIIQPSSKRQAIEFLKDFLGIEHRREYFYRDLTKMRTIKEPGKIKRAKYVKIQNQSYLLNEPLMEKNELLLGIKGYYTNLEQSEVEDKTIIEHYHNLWQIEHAFRITKSDLQIRPVYHYKKEMIEVHVLICFMALVVCKYMELKTEKSTQSILKQLKSVTDARIKNKLNGQEIILRSEINSDIKTILEKLHV